MSIKENNFLIIVVTIFMLAACGSNKDVDAVSYYIFDQKDSLSEKDARCLAKNFKKLRAMINGILGLKLLMEK
tara:strand:+ start:496 stop:714 length:219 start_codon:yes stop_codon:yes gene_type:complete